VGRLSTQQVSHARWDRGAAGGDQPGWWARWLDRPQRSQLFRGDIEGLRAVAILLVLLWHAGVPLISGGYVGVDVFFVISGFLITGRLMRDVVKTGRVSLLGFYAARVERLLPAATLTLYTVLLLMYVSMPDVRWQDTTSDVIASAFYVVNWTLAGRSVDYLGAERAPSAVQHFWSLAVEEQFYLIWPLLLLIAVLIIKRRREHALSRLRRTLLRSLAVIGGVSLIWSIIMTFTDPGPAYFVTTTRMWELALGAAVAVAVPILPRLSRVDARYLAWAGIVAIALAATLFSSSTPFPGFAAALPTLGAAAVIAAGSLAVPDRSVTADPLTPPPGGIRSWSIGPTHWLDTRPMRAIGGLSYSLYLWHWPLLVIFAANFGPLPWPAGLAVTALSVIPAYAAYRIIETPIRRWHLLTRPPTNAIVAIGICALVAATAGLLTLIPQQRGRPPVLDAMHLPDIGAVVLAESPRGDAKGVPVDKADFTPSAAGARTDLPPIDKDKCFADANQVELKYCQYGPDKAAVTAVLLGDSHAAQWSSALKPIAETLGWRLRVYTKSACPYLRTDITVAGEKRLYEECSQWNDRIHAMLTADRPTLVFVTSSDFDVLKDGRAQTGEAGRGARIEAQHATWAELSQQRLTTIVIRDNPHAPFDIPECVSRNTDHLLKCAFPRDAAISGIGADQAAATVGLDGVHLIDLTDAICPDDQCPAVIGGVLIYRDSHHVTGTYVVSLTPRMFKAIRSIVPASP
jgi:peptidoglycan/LPS O-acetylase OafA/YrhL